MCVRECVLSCVYGVIVLLGITCRRQFRNLWVFMSISCYIILWFICFVIDIGHDCQLVMLLTKHFDISLVKLCATSRFSLGQERRGEIFSISGIGENGGCQRRVDKQPYISNANEVAEVDLWATKKKKSNQ